MFTQHPLQEMLVAVHTFYLFSAYTFAKCFICILFYHSNSSRYIAQNLLSLQKRHKQENNCKKSCNQLISARVVFFLTPHCYFSYSMLTSTLLLHLSQFLLISNRNNNSCLILIRDVWLK